MYFHPHQSSILSYTTIDESQYTSLYGPDPTGHPFPGSLNDVFIQSVSFIIFSNICFGASLIHANTHGILLYALTSVELMYILTVLSSIFTTFTQYMFLNSGPPYNPLHQYIMSLHLFLIAVSNVNIKSSDVTGTPSCHLASGLILTSSTVALTQLKSASIGIHVSVTKLKNATSGRVNSTPGAFGNHGL